MDDLSFGPGKAKEPLTGCYNKDDLMPFLYRLGSSIDKEQGCFSVLSIDVDHFRKYNESYGHAFGDRILQHFSGVLLANIGSERNFSFRTGSDEFVVVFPFTKPQEVKETVSFLAGQMLKTPLAAEGRKLYLTFSAGIAGYPADGFTVGEVLKCANEARDISKRKGVSRVTVYLKKVYLFRKLCVAFVALVGIIGLIMLLQSVDMPFIKKKLAFFSSKALQKGEAVVLHLQSGKLSKGVFIRESGNTITIRKQTKSGEMVMKYKKSDIKKINRVEEP